MNNNPHDGYWRGRSPSYSSVTKPHKHRRYKRNNSLAHAATVLLATAIALFYLGLSGHFGQSTSRLSIIENPSSVVSEVVSRASAIAVLLSTTESTLSNPSWSELEAFLLGDKTDQAPYIYPTYVCEDFARALQENAEKAGWRCGFVTVDVEGYPDWYGYGIPSDTGHALNAFETTDRGLVYIDCTGLPSGEYRPSSCDKVVSVSIGKECQPVSIFPELGWSDTWESMGTVTDVDIRW